MKAISPKTKRQLEADPRMKQCVVANSECSGRIQWHHVWIYAGGQIDEPWAIVGICDHHHEMVKKDVKIKVAAERASLELASAEDLLKYEKKDWAAEARRIEFHMKQ